MSRDYDVQVVESVAVRRRRLREAWLFGPDRIRNSLNEHVGKVFTSVITAAVACAGCAGWSYFQQEMAKEKENQQPVPSGNAVR